MGCCGILKEFLLAEFDAEFKRGAPPPPKSHENLLYEYMTSVDHMTMAKIPKRRELFVAIICSNSGVRHGNAIFNASSLSNVVCGRQLRRDIYVELISS